MIDAIRSGATVVPLDARDADRDPWQLLAAGDGLLVSWTDGGVPSGREWGAPLRATSSIARQLGKVAGELGDSPIVRGGGRLYRLEIPSDFGVDDLVSAVGGGFRTAVRKQGTAKIAGHAKLVPVTMASRLAASGPALGLMALTIAAEMAGGNTQEATLTAIRQGVDRINARMDMATDADLLTAAQAIEQAHSALLDGAQIPESIGLGPAMNRLQSIRNTSILLLDGWEQVVGDLPAGAVSGTKLRDALGAVGFVGWDGFADEVRRAYTAIALDSRRIMLTAAEAQLHNPEMPLTTFRRTVEAGLAKRAHELERLRAILRRLSTVPLSVSAWKAPNLISGDAEKNARTQALFASLTMAFSTAPGATGLPVADGRVTIEAEVLEDGGVQLHRPA